MLTAYCSTNQACMAVLRRRNDWLSHLGVHNRDALFFNPSKGTTSDLPSKNDASSRASGCAFIVIREGFVDRLSPSLSSGYQRPQPHRKCPIGIANVTRRGFPPSCLRCSVPSLGPPPDSALSVWVPAVTFFSSGFLP